MGGSRDALELGLVQESNIVDRDADTLVVLDVLHQVVCVGLPPIPGRAGFVCYTTKVTAVCLRFGMVQLTSIRLFCSLEDVWRDRTYGVVISLHEGGSTPGICIDVFHSHGTGLL